MARGKVQIWAVILYCLIVSCNILVLAIGYSNDTNCVCITLSNDTKHVCITWIITVIIHDDGRSDFALTGS